MRTSKKIFVVTLITLVLFSALVVNTLILQKHEQDSLKERENLFILSLQNASLSESNQTIVWKSKDFTIANWTYKLDIYIPNFGVFNLENETKEVYRNTDSGKVLQYAIDNHHGFTLTKNEWYSVKDSLVLENDVTINGNDSNIIFDGDGALFIVGDIDKGFTIWISKIHIIEQDTVNDTFFYGWGADVNPN